MKCSIKTFLSNTSDTLSAVNCKLTLDTVISEQMVRKNDASSINNLENRKKINRSHFFVEHFCTAINGCHVP